MPKHQLCSYCTPHARALTSPSTMPSKGTTQGASLAHSVHFYAAPFADRTHTGSNPWRRQHDLLSTDPETARWGGLHLHEFCGAQTSDAQLVQQQPGGLQGGFLAHHAAEPPHALLLQPPAGACLQRGSAQQVSPVLALSLRIQGLWPQGSGRWIAGLLIRCASCWSDSPAGPPRRYWTSGGQRCWGNGSYTQRQESRGSAAGGA